MLSFNEEVPLPLQPHCLLLSLDLSKIVLNWRSKAVFLFLLFYSLYSLHNKIIQENLTVFWYHLPSTQAAQWEILRCTMSPYCIVKWFVTQYTLFLLQCHFHHSLFYSYCILSQSSVSLQVCVCIAGCVPLPLPGLLPEVSVLGRLAVPLWLLLGWTLDDGDDRGGVEARGRD